MEFTTQADLKEFSLSLQAKLQILGEISLAKELREWNDDFFTTSSEFLGELKLILEKASSLMDVDDETIRDINNCLSVINQAFDNK